MKTNRPLTVVALLLSLSMAAMEMTVVSTAMPTVVGDLGGIHFYSWVFTAYLLTSTVTVPLYGKLADLYGRKPVLLAGIAIFLVGSMASGLSHSIGALVAFRALQGLGAGAMQPTTLTIVGDIYNLEERSRMQGVFGAVWGVAGLIGPLLGGVIVKYLSWRWVFFINVPAGIAAAALLMLALHEQVEHRRHSLDWAGSGLLMLGLVALLAGTHGGLASALGLPLAVIFLALFLHPGASLHVAQAASALFGVGLGLANTVLLIAVQTSVEWRQRGVATASTMFARTIGGTLAVGALGGILTATLLSNGSVPTEAADQLLGPAHGAGLDPAVLRALSASLQSGLGVVFWVIAGIAVAAAATSLLFPQVPVTSQPAQPGLAPEPAGMTTLPPER